MVTPTRVEFEVELGCDNLILAGGPILKVFDLGVKWSAFENGGPDPAGVTQYKPIKKYQGSQALQDNDRALQKQLLKMTKCYQPALLDVLKRQESISEFCVPSCPHPYAAGLGIYYSQPCLLLAFWSERVACASGAT